MDCRGSRSPGSSLLVLVGAVALVLSACGADEGAHEPPFRMGADPAPDVEAFETGLVLEKPAPPFEYLSDGEALACSDCHDDPDEDDLKRRELKLAHTDIVFRHDERSRWCLDCHDAENRDSLRLANGTLVSPDQSYRLCGQCHGDKYRDWRAGVHGRRVGQWNGEKQYRLCVHCHDAHAPRFKPLTPEPRPVRPEELR